MTRAVRKISHELSFDINFYETSWVNVFIRIFVLFQLVWLTGLSTVTLRMFCFGLFLRIWEVFI